MSVYYHSVKKNNFTRKGRFLDMTKGKDLKYSLLLDYYGNILTGKQKDAIELYYNEDLSLGEISEHLDISRQGVRDCIQRGTAILDDLEEKLKIIENYSDIDNKIDKVLILAGVVKQKASGWKALDEINLIISILESIRKEERN